MPTPKQLEAANLYAGLLEEVKARIAAIDAGTSGSLALPAPIVREHCFLQLRMSCEIIALGCLIAHGDITETQSRKLRKEWAADKIMDELEKLHPDFYPRPVTQIPREGGWHFDPVKEHPLPKADLLKLYYRCGSVLHRGSVKKIISERMPLVINYPEITAVAQRVHDLLRLHLLLMRDGKHVFVAMLRNADDNNRVQVAIAESGVPQS